MNMACYLGASHDPATNQDHPCTPMLVQDWVSAKYLVSIETRNER